MVDLKNLWTKDASKNTLLNDCYGGYRVDLKLKKKRPNEYYSCSSANLFYELKIPVDLNDLKKASKNGFLKYLKWTKTLGRLLPGNRLSRPVFEFAKHYESVNVWEDLAKKYPRVCKNCKYARFFLMTLSRYSMGIDATFACPYCEKRKKLNWSDKW